MLKAPGYYKVKTQFKVNSTHCVNTYPVGMTIHIKDVYPEQVIIGSSNKDVRAPISIFDNLEK